MNTGTISDDCGRTKIARAIHPQKNSLGICMRLIDWFRRDGRMRRLLNIGLLAMKIIDAVVPKNKVQVLFYSKPDFSDNGRALYEEFVRQKLGETYKAIWLVNGDCKKLKEKYPQITFYRKNTIKGFLCFARSAFIFRSHVLYGNVRTKKQIVTMAWHGMGIKGPVDFNVKRNCIDFVTVTSDLYRFKLATRLNCSPSRAIITGLPRNDFMFQGRYEECLKSLPKYLEHAGCKTVLWMPTYHVNETSGDKHGKYYELGIPVVKAHDLSQLNTLLEACNVVLLIKLHPHMIGEGGINREDYSHIQVFDDSFLPADCSLYHLLAGVDAMLTDYSSVFTDYMLLNRPIGFIYDDFEEYSKNPGFAFERVKLMMPGPHIHTVSGLIQFINDIADGKDSYAEERNRLNQLVNFYCDAGNSRRVLETVGLLNQEKK